MTCLEFSSTFLHQARIERLTGHCKVDVYTVQTYQNIFVQYFAHNI
jgi:hypothetical protein